MFKKHKNRLPPFVPLLVSTLDSPAWKAMSHGAARLYVALRRRVLKGRNRAFISYRTAERELSSSRRKIAEWFGELAHYGFIKLAVPGSLGVEGKGKAPHWRLTELGQMSRTSAEGLFEPPTNDFLRWDGTPFDPKPFRQTASWHATKLGKQNPGDDVGNGVVTTRETPLVTTSETPKPETGDDGVAIEATQSGDDVGDITRFTTPCVLTPRSQPRSLSSSRPSSESRLEAENTVGHFEDPRIASLPAMEQKRRRAS